MDEHQLRSWAGSISFSQWDYFVEVAENSDFLQFNEVKLIRDIARSMEAGRWPSAKQLNWAQSIVEKIEIHEEREREEHIGVSGVSDHPIGVPARHLTIRLAWHDNKWNGRVCLDPEGNDYCVGEHSLLSRRIRENRDLKIEKEQRGKLVDLRSDNKYLPPCYWSINAFGSDSLVTEHMNPAAPHIKAIPDKLPPYSVFSWPFMLSFVRDKKMRDLDGNYPANLETRIAKFDGKVQSNHSLVFLYTNYDNPVSADERKYLLVGVSWLRNKGEPTHFNIPKGELQKIRKRYRNQNFPTINWTLRYSLGGPEETIVLPYHEYLTQAEISNSYERLNEIKVVIDEPELQHCFKYVAMDIDDDSAIYLLTKIRKSLNLIEEHGLPGYPTERNRNLVKEFLNHCWHKRTYVPGIRALAGAFLERDERDYPELEAVISKAADESTEEHLDRLKTIFAPVENRASIGPKVRGCLDDIQDSLDALEIDWSDFLKLSLLNLTRHQFEKILSGRHGIASQSLKDIAENPYLLFEDYLPDKHYEDPKSGLRIDGPIDLFRIDIAHFPDSNFLPRDRSIQDMSVADRKRIRALAIMYLREIESDGHCYLQDDQLEDILRNYPLFYKTTYLLPAGVLVEPQPDMLKHLSKKLHRQLTDSGTFYYLKEVRRAEENIRDVVESLMSRPDYDVNDAPTEQFWSGSVEILRKRLGERFDEKLFLSERQGLYSGLMSKSFYILAGGPGTGKSYELLQVIDQLRQRGEQVTVLTPTGKAALRLRKNEEGFANIPAQTIDMYLTRCSSAGSGRPVIENLIIDESSMIDLLKLDRLLNIVNYESPSFKRLILVGDPNQLGPIGYGKPFFDFVHWLLKKPERNAHMTELQHNCRQELDEEILTLASVFAGENKFYDDILGRVAKGGQISPGLHVSFWKTRDQLRKQITDRFDACFSDSQEEPNRGEILDEVFGFDARASTLKLDAIALDTFQVISPYRSGFYGTLSINNYIQREYRHNQQLIAGGQLLFKAGDKLIQTENVYSRGELLLSNGSLGIALHRSGAELYFVDNERTFGKKELNLEAIELAYAITVHKAQGSGFNEVFVVIPRKPGLLSRELIYTALTRSRRKVSLFICGEPDENIENLLLFKYRNVSHVDRRRTSVFSDPGTRTFHSPEAGVEVRSKSEYIIYSTLQKMRATLGGFSFQYEKEYLSPTNGQVMHPDFTIQIHGGPIFYWEHLGLIGKNNYEKTWLIKRATYFMDGLQNTLLTTDELSGIDNATVEEIIRKMIESGLEEDDQRSSWSQHHFSLG